MKYIIFSILLVSIFFIGCSEANLNKSDFGGDYISLENYTAINLSQKTEPQPVTIHNLPMYRIKNQSDYVLRIQPPYEVMPMDECLGIEGVKSCDMILHSNESKITWVMEMDVKQMYSMLGKYLKEKSKNITDVQLRQRNMTRAEFDNTLDSMINGSIFDKESD